MWTSDESLAGAVTLTPPDPELTLAAPAIRQGRWSHRSVVRGWALPGLDLVALTLAALVAAATTNTRAAPFLSPAFPVFAVMMLASRGAYTRRLRLIVLDSLGLAAGSISVAAMAALAISLLFVPSSPGADLLFRAWALGLVFVSVARVGFIFRQQHQRAARTVVRRTLIIGAGEVGARIGRRLEQAPAYGLMPVGFVDDDPPNETAVGGRPGPVLGGTDELPELVERYGVEHVILAFSMTADGVLLPLLRRVAANGIGVSIVPRLFDAIDSRPICEAVGGLPIVTLRETASLSPTFRIKHAVDRVVAVMLLALLAPVLLVIGLLIRCESPGPVLFRQRRIGCDDRPFDVLKFRTMRLCDDAHEASFVPIRGLAPGGVEGTDRRTRLGRWLRMISLDELPQLVNVVRGEMSLVGPRPERPEYVAMFAADMARYTERHRVKAGITGLSQVHGLRGQSSIPDRVELDNYYIENWSLGLDFKILLMTVLAVLKPVD